MHTLTLHTHTARTHPDLQLHKATKIAPSGIDETNPGFVEDGYVVVPLCHLMREAMKLLGKIATLVLQLCSKGQVGPSTFKKTNLVPQLLFLGQICPYTDDAPQYHEIDVKSHFYP